MAINPEALSLLHGFLGTIFIMCFTGAIVAIFSFKKQRYKLLKYSILFMTISVIIIDILGVSIYVTYRSADPSSARSKILASDNPWVHNILMEFKEFAGVFVAIFMILINYLVVSYKSKILEDKNLRYTLILLLATTMLLTLATFGLGAYITKVQPI